MIMFFIRSILWFSASFVILSVPVNKRPLFSHLSGVFGPSAQNIIDDFGDKAETTIKVGKDAIHKLFKASPEVMDHLDVKQSAALRNDDPIEDYTVEERALLKNILEQQ